MNTNNKPLVLTDEEIQFLMCAVESIIGNAADADQREALRQIWRKLIALRDRPTHPNR